MLQSEIENEAYDINANIDVKYRDPKKMLHPEIENDTESMYVKP